MPGVSGSVHHDVACGFTAALVLNTEQKHFARCLSPATWCQRTLQETPPPRFKTVGCVPWIHAFTVHTRSLLLWKQRFLQKTRLCCPSLSHQPVHIRSVCPWIVLVKGFIVKTAICLIFIKMWNGFWLVIRTDFPTASKPAPNMLLSFSTTFFHKLNSHHWQT